MPYKTETDRLGRKHIVFDNPDVQRTYDALFALGSPDRAPSIDITNWRELSKICYVHESGKMMFPFDVNPMGQSDQLQGSLLEQTLTNLKGRTLMYIDPNRLNKPYHIQFQQTNKGTTEAKLQEGIPAIENPAPVPQQPNPWQRFWHSVTGGRLYRARFERLAAETAAYDAQETARNMDRGAKQYLADKWPDWESKAADSKYVAPRSQRLAEVQHESEQSKVIDKVSMEIFGPESAEKLTSTFAQEVRGTDTAALHQNLEGTIFDDKDLAVLSQMETYSPINAGVLSDSNGKTVEENRATLAKAALYDLPTAKDRAKNFAEKARTGRKVALNSIREFSEGHTELVTRTLEQGIPAMVRLAMRNQDGLEVDNLHVLEQCAHTKQLLDKLPAEARPALADEDIMALEYSSNLLEVHDKANEAKAQLLSGIEQNPAKCRDLAVDVMAEVYMSAVMHQNGKMAQKEAIDTPIDKKTLDLMRNPSRLSELVKNGPVMQELDEMVNTRGISYADAVSEKLTSMANQFGMQADKMLEAQPVPEPGAQPAMQKEEAPLQRSINEVKLQQPELGQPQQEKQLDKSGMQK